MKKIFFVVFTTFFFAVLCFAAEGPGMTPDEHEPMVKEIKSQSSRQGVIAVGSMTFTGKLYSISQPDAAQGTKHEITVIADKGEKKTFSLIPGLSITDSKEQIIPLKDLRPEDKLVVEYTISKAGVNRALSITLQ
jgi:hypothetical protein